MVSRVAKIPVKIPEGVSVNVSNFVFTASGQYGTLSHSICDNVKVDLENGLILVAAKNNSKFSVAMSGTVRAIIANLVNGVFKPFECLMMLVGVGYKVKIDADTLELSVGFSHPVRFCIPEGLKVDVKKQTEFVVIGIDKHAVYQFAAKVRAVRPPERYKGKGIRYADEKIILKETKKK